MTAIADFLSGAGRLPGTGDAVFGYVQGTAGDADAAAVQARESGTVARVLRGGRMRTLEALFDEFAAAWQFPHYFGHNKDAFDECMRDLDEFVGDGAGYVVVIRDSEQLLADEADQRPWFDEAMEFYADEWQPKVFRVLMQGNGDAPRGSALVNLRSA